jgi:hypothetical protein
MKKVRIESVSDTKLKSGTMCVMIDVNKQYTRRIMFLGIHSVPQRRVVVYSPLNFEHRNYQNIPKW